MDDQTKVADESGQHRDGESDGMFRLAREAMELGELQVRLLLLDVQNSSANARAAVLYIVLAAVVVLCAAQVALLWLAAALVAWAGWSWVAALATSAGVGVLLAAVLMRVAWVHWQRGIFTWERSRSELAKSVAWLKSSLAGRGSVADDSHQRTTTPQ